MDITDAQGHPLGEVTLRLDPREVADLLVGASSIDDGSADHAVIRDEEGRSVALYLGSGGTSPLQRHSDWWVGPILLLIFVFLAAGAYTLAHALVHALF